MFCRKCGYKNDDNALHCVNCGEPMRKSTTAQPVQEQRPQQALEQPRVAVAVKKKSGKAGTIFVFILFLLVVGGCGTVGYFAYSQNAQTTLEVAGFTDVEETTEEETETVEQGEETTEGTTEDETEETTEEADEPETELDDSARRELYSDMASECYDEINNIVSDYVDDSDNVPTSDELVDMLYSIDLEPSDEDGIAAVVCYNDDDGSVDEVVIMSDNDWESYESTGDFGRDFVYGSLYSGEDIDNATIVGIYDGLWVWKTL